MDYNITAKEGFIDAEKYVKQKYGDNPMYNTYIIARGDITDSGKCSAWDYYITIKLSDINYEGFILTIYSNGKNKLYGPGNTDTPPSSHILNWSIDSNEAVKIAESIEQIDNFLSKYKRANIVHMQLSMSKTYSIHNAIWSIHWTDYGFLDNPHNADAIIDANTGKVLEFLAD